MPVSGRANYVSYRGCKWFDEITQGKSGLSKETQEAIGMSSVFSPVQFSPHSRPRKCYPLAKAQAGAVVIESNALQLLICFTESNGVWERIPSC